MMSEEFLNDLSGFDLSTPEQLEKFLAYIADMDNNPNIVAQTGDGAVFTDKSFLLTKVTGDRFEIHAYDNTGKALKGIAIVAKKK